MNSNRYRLLTSGVPAAIAVIEFSGSDAADWIRRHWEPASASFSSVTGGKASDPLTLDRIRFGMFCSSGAFGSPAATNSIGLHSPNEAATGAEVRVSDVDRDGAIAGEAVVLCRTGADRYELHCHGGRTAANIVTQCLKDSGFEQSDRLSSVDTDLDSQISLAAWEDLQRAISLEVAGTLMDQYRGALARKLQNIIQMIQQSQIAPAISGLEELNRCSDLGLHLIEPWKIVLAGPPNVGKSSLLNAILGYRRAIVHESAGTTRDLLAEHTSLGGWPVLITDSAGVRETGDTIEGAGIAASLDAVSTAECLLLLVSPEIGWQREHDSILSAFRGKRLIVVQTKSDLGRCDHLPLEYPIASTSVSDANSIENLLVTVEKLLVPEIPAAGTAVPFRPQYALSVQRGLGFLRDGRLEDAIRVIASVF